MKRLLIFISLLILTFCAYGQAVFQRSYGGPGNEYGRAVIECSTGGYLIAGSTNSYYNPSTDVYLLRVDDNGDYLWGKNIGDSNKIDWGIDLAEDADGNFIIAGYTDDSPSGSYDGLLIKTDPEGQVIWKKTFGGDDWDFIESMTINSEDEIILAGSKTVNGIQKGWIFKTDSDGELIWERLIDSSGDLKLTGSDICQNEEIVFTGFTNNPILNTKTFIAGKLSQDGNILWSSNYPEYGKVVSGKCACSDDNSLVGIGTVFQVNDHSKFFYFKIDAEQGTTIWKIIIDSDGEAIGTGIAVQPNLNILLAASVVGIGYLYFDSGSYVVRPDGPLISEEFSESLGGNGVDMVYDITPTSDGGYITTGETNSFGNGYQVHLCKIDSIGTRDEQNVDFLDLATTIKPLDDTDNLRVYPNPSSDNINLDLDFTEELAYSIISATGSKVDEGILKLSNEKAISISALENGIYFITIIEAGKTKYYGRFVKLP